MEKNKLTAFQFCDAVGIARNRGLLHEMRKLNLFKFYKSGSKFCYFKSEVAKVEELLKSGRISIKVNGKYYVTIND